MTLGRAVIGLRTPGLPFLEFYMKFDEHFVDTAAHCLFYYNKVSLEFGMPETVDGVVVDHADGLHEGIADRGADKPEAALFQLLAHCFRSRGFGRDIRQAFPVVAYRFVVDELPDIRIETAEFRLNLEKCLGIGNSRLNF